MLVQHERVAAGRSIQGFPFIAASEDAHVAEIYQDLALGKALFGSLRILRVTGIQVGGLQPPDGLDILESLQTPV